MDDALPGTSRLPHLPRRGLLALGSTAAAGLGLGALGPGSASAMTARAAQRRIAYDQWAGSSLHLGQRDGVVLQAGRLHFGHAAGSRTWHGVGYETATWTSPWTSVGFGLTRLIASWNASTPGNSWIEIRVRGRRSTGRPTGFDVLGRWAAGDRYVKRQTVSGQSDDATSVDADTWQVAPSAGLDAYQLQVVLLRKRGTTAVPAISSVGAVASALPADAGPTSKPGAGRGIDLDVPGFSQMIHSGEYPQFNGGGEAWCSPTSTSMVLGYYGALPRKKAQAFAPGHPDPWVDYAARMVFDYDYDGAGNWPFNTAYAGALAGHAFVTRLRSLHEAERFIAARIPLVASISFGSGDLDGAPISSTAGHLVVIRGFTADGDPIINDPAARTDASVRHVYDRAQFERAWLAGSGGVVYVIHDDAHPLPTGGQTNWG